MYWRNSLQRAIDQAKCASVVGTWIRVSQIQGFISKYIRILTQTTMSYQSENITMKGSPYHIGFVSHTCVGSLSWNQANVHIYIHSRRSSWLIAGKDKLQTIIVLPQVEMAIHRLRVCINHALFETSEVV